MRNHVVTTEFAESFNGTELAFNGLAKFAPGGSFLLASRKSSKRYSDKVKRSSESYLQETSRDGFDAGSSAMIHISEDRGEFHTYFAAVCGLILIVALAVGAVSYATVGKIFRTVTDVASAAGVTEIYQNVDPDHINVAITDAIPLALIAVLLLAAAARYAGVKPTGPPAESDKPRTPANAARDGGKFWRAEQARSRVQDLHLNPRPRMVLSKRIASRRRYPINPA